MTTALPTRTLVERSQPVKTTVRVYLRQSKGQDQQRESVPTQRAECQRLTQALGVSDTAWARRKEYIDVDRGGDDATREDLARLLREAEAGDLVVAWKQDRVGRDMIDSAAAIRELVKFRGCHLYTVETGTVPILLDTAEKTALVMFRGMVAQGELERIRSRTRDGLRQRARDGFATGTVPFGYRTVLVDPTVTDRKKSKKRIAINESEAQIVRRIFRMYADGRGYVKVCKALNTEGVPSPRGNGWSPTAVWDMLREERYGGHWTHGERRVVRREGKRVIMEAAPEEDVIRLDRPELAIIPQDEWARVKAAMATRKRDMTPQRAALASAVVHPLSNLLHCDECGAPMRIKKCDSRTTNWSRRYYVCTNRLRTKRCGNAIHLPAEDTEQKLTTYLGGSVVGQIESSARQSIRDEVRRVVETADARAGEADQLREEIDSLRRERQRLVRLAAATDDPVSEVGDALSVNQERAKSLQEALALATRPPIDPALAERLEAVAAGQVQRMREQLAGGELREVLTVLFPSGLRFKVGGGLWLIEGAASVPTVRGPDRIRIPVATSVVAGVGRDASRGNCSCWISARRVLCGVGIATRSQSRRGT